MIPAQVRQSRFLRFCIVGLGGLVVDATILAFALHIIHLGPYAARALSFSIAVTFTWWGNRQLTFAASRARNTKAVALEWMRFVLANSLGGVINYGTYALLIAFGPTPLNNPFVALAFGVVAGVTLNFTLSSRLVFRTKTQR